MQLACDKKSTYTQKLLLIARWICKSSKPACDERWQCIWILLACHGIKRQPRSCCFSSTQSVAAFPIEMVVVDHRRPRIGIFITTGERFVVKVVITSQNCSFLIQNLFLWIFLINYVIGDNNWDRLNIVWHTARSEFKEFRSQLDWDICGGSVKGKMGLLVRRVRCLIIASSQFTRNLSIPR